ncbi:ribulose-phosphate 3-epimerase [Platysternon megacephalum]|uniref:Ribulose-phosphate 3-epimerase n=1 Tax=Platysternon megacephalum TaxID=55544 RepID=A0A4D9DG09_9SAUR|nr:ribulose-phosphate 3-epimerase [Platysternon megacephalum]
MGPQDGRRTLLWARLLTRSESLESAPGHLPSALVDPHPAPVTPPIPALDPLAPVVPNECVCGAGSGLPPFDTHPHTPAPFQEDFNVSCLTDGNADTYWESDGSQGQHWVRLTMKKGTIVK